VIAVKLGSCRLGKSLCSSRSLSNMLVAARCQRKSKGRKYFVKDNMVEVITVFVFVIGLQHLF
jgi:hypothetical protein